MPPGLIGAVARGSLAARAGLQAGDHLVSINDQTVRDVIDVRVYASEEHLVLTALREGATHTAVIDRRYGETLGLEFATPTFDAIRRCRNRCEFCFLNQMPGKLRSSLYIRDDDYRYSFLFGSFVTLSSLDEDDWRRIDEQRLSPLYVSVHATDPQLRRQMLGNWAAPDVVEQLLRLANLRIETHTQIVVIPGINDDAHLDRSLGDLADLYPDVRSVSVVPVGVTRYHRGGCRALTVEEMHRVREQVDAWQAKLLSRLGARFVYLSDEWYLRLGEPVPSTAAYDGLDLVENGVGAVRRFLDGADYSLRPLFESSLSHTLVTGALFAPVLRNVTSDWDRLAVAVVPNRFFGETVTVAGLLTGGDVMSHLDGEVLGDLVVLPPAMFGGPTGQTLDEMSPDQIARSLGRPVAVGVPRDGAGSLASIRPRRLAGVV